MKTLYWILGFATLIIFMQYDLLKEHGQPQQISLPVAVVR